MLVAPTFLPWTKSIESVIGKASAISGAPITAVENGSEKQSVRDLLSVTFKALTCCVTGWHGPALSAQAGAVAGTRPKPAAAAPAVASMATQTRRRVAAVRPFRPHSRG